MRVSARTRAGVVGVAIVALLVAGCAPTSTTTKKQTVDATASDINPHPVADLREGGDLRLPLQSFPPQWNGYHLDGALADVSQVENTALPAVFRFDAAGQRILDTDYVTKAELASQEPETVRYTLNDKAVWSDGTPLSWKDFDAIWKANNGTNPEYQAADTTGYRDIASVTRGVTDRDVVVTFATHFGEWQKLFNTLYPAQWIDTPEKFNTGWLGKVPASAGPFRLSTESFDTVRQTVTVTRDDRWWGTRPVLDTVTFRALEGNADLDAYLNNELDIAPAATTARYNRVKDAPDADIRTSSSSSFSHLTFGSRGVFKDAATRVAVSQAIDRTAIVKTLFDGLPITVDTLGNHLLLATDTGYEDHSGELSFDVAAANAGLDAAGWVRHGNVRERAGKKLEASITFAAGATWAQQTAEILQQQLAAIGLTLKIAVVPAETFFKETVTPGNFDIAAFLWAGTGYVTDALSIYQEGDNTQNYGKISTPHITATLNQAAQALDETERTRLINEADKAIWAEGHSLPLAQSPRLNVVRHGLANLGASPGLAQVDWTIVGWVKE